MTAQAILEKAKWNKDTCWEDQLTFVAPDGKLISAVRSKEGMTRKEVEEILVERVQTLYGAY